MELPKRPKSKILPNVDKKKIERYTEFDEDGKIAINFLVGFISFCMGIAFYAIITS
jgi:uncharacterized protein (DUF2164 family)